MTALDLAVRNISEKPFPYVANDRFIDPQLYAQLRDSFPVCPPNTGPTGFSLFWGDAAYQRLLDSQPAWQTLFDSVHSQDFIDWGMKQFADVFRRDGCKFDLSNARYVHYLEDRIDKERAALRNVEHAPDELFVRMDIYQGHVGYSRGIHHDYNRRVISMLIYFCDQDETHMEGGELLLHPKKFARWIRPTVTIRPKHNLMVAFPCSKRSWHSVPPITSLYHPRNYIQVHISSSVDAW
ncbi:MAG: hypothetical protein QOE82_1304 [Thermoanaerobaculia bacterium]|jgi:hypothetical protein|nr:hypothetical protein [Thermoanaerobaculia bacterium]